MRFAGFMLGVLLAGLIAVAGSGRASAEFSGATLLRGDFNCDGGNNSLDALIILQYTAGLTPHPKCKSLANLNGDGMISALDAALLLQVDADLVRYFKRYGNLARGETPGCTLITNESESIEIIGTIPTFAPGQYVHVWGFFIDSGKGCAFESMRIFSITYFEPIPKG
jgi:hypothetical protein